MSTTIPGPLPGPLRKYERVIDQIIGEMGVAGKIDEFKKEGKIAVCQAEVTFYSIITDMTKDTYMDRSIRNHFRKLLGI